MRRKLEAQLKDFAACRGHLGDSAKRFKSCLDLQADIGKRYRACIDLCGRSSSPRTRACPRDSSFASARRCSARSVDEATSFVRPEILRLGKAKVDALLKQDKSLAIYRQPLDEILRAAPHTLDAKGEAIIATFGLAAGAAGSTYAILSNADLPWPTVTLSDGSEVTLDQSAYTQLSRGANRDDRKKVFDAFWGTWKEFERTFGVTFYENLK